MRLVSFCAVLLMMTSCAGKPLVFTGDSAWRYLVDQCNFGPRVPGSRAHEQTVELISGVLRHSGAEVSLQRFQIDDPYGDGPLPVVNVIGRFHPHKKPRVLLAAHFDSRPWADQEPDEALHETPILGANDGASGVAVLLELAELLGRKEPPRFGVDLVFFDAEDYGKEGDLDYYCIGSKHYASKLGEDRPEKGILLDLVGAKDARILQEGYSITNARELTLDVFARAKRLGLTVFVAQPTQAYYDDHVPLLQAGVPMVDLIGLPYEHWHRLSDTADKCSKETLKQVGTLVSDFVYDPGR